MNSLKHSPTHRSPNIASQFVATTPSSPAQTARQIDESNNFEEHQQLVQLKQALTDLIFSFSTNSVVITDQAKVRCKEVHNQLVRTCRDWINRLQSNPHCYDLFYDAILYYCNLNQFHTVNPPQHQLLAPKRTQCLQHLRDCFGSDSLLLSDYCKRITLWISRM